MLTELQLLTSDRASYEECS